MNEETGPAPAPLTVVFRKPDAGWIDIEVAPLTDQWHVSATHLTWHFVPLLRWLEAVLDGAEVARWSVDGEGLATQFIYVAPTYSVFDTAARGLVAIQTGGLKPPRFSFVQVERLDLVRAFYEALRFYADTIYDPSDWETNDALETDWGGEPVRLLRSQMIEAALSGGDDEQFSFKLPLSWKRR